MRLFFLSLALSYASNAYLETSLSDLLHDYETSATIESYFQAKKEPSPDDYIQEKPETSYDRTTMENPKTPPNNETFFKDHPSIQAQEEYFFSSQDSKNPSIPTEQHNLENLSLDQIMLMEEEAGIDQAPANSTAEMQEQELSSTSSTSLSPITQAGIGVGATIGTPIVGGAAWKIISSIGRAAAGSANDIAEAAINNPLRAASVVATVTGRHDLANAALMTESAIKNEESRKEFMKNAEAASTAAQKAMLQSSQNFSNALNPSDFNQNPYTRPSDSFRARGSR